MAKKDKKCAAHAIFFFFFCLLEKKCAARAIVFLLIRFFLLIRSIDLHVHCCPRLGLHDLIFFVHKYY